MQNGAFMCANSYQLSSIYIIYLSPITYCKINYVKQQNYILQANKIGMIISDIQCNMKEIILELHEELF